MPEPEGLFQGNKRGIKGKDIIARMEEGWGRGK
jgi:hypothetical protein